jgi:hypothetical protein
MKTEDLIDGIWRLARPSPRAGEDPKDKARITQVLDALISSQDPALIEVIPIFLALCGQAGFSMDISALLSDYRERYGPQSERTETLERCLFIAVDLLIAEGIEIDSEAVEQAKRLKQKWGMTVSSGLLELGCGITLKMSRLLEVFKSYSIPAPDPQSHPGHALGAEPTQTPPELHNHLRLIFSPKQEELVMKRLRGGGFSKTEREYYSRVVKKKLQALADTSLQALASKLLSK